MHSKICAICKLELPIKNFYKNKKKKDGFDPKCKECFNNRCWSKYQELHQNFLNNSNELICKKCKKYHTVGISNLCYDCWFKRKSYEHFDTYEYYKDLINIAENQKFICIYSGEKLIPGLNMQLDHIFPKSPYLNLSKDINNVQWIERRMNLLKLDKTHIQFVNFLKRYIQTDKILREKFPEKYKDYPPLKINPHLFSDE